MDRSLRWMLGSGVGAFLAGLAGAYVTFTSATFREPALAAMLFVAIVAGSFLGVRAHRHGLRLAVPTGALSSGLAVVGFFLTPVLLWWDDGIHLGTIGLVAAVAFAFATTCSALGTAFLARGVDRYRARHGMIHAPR